MVFFSSCLQFHLFLTIAGFLNAHQEPDERSSAAIKEFRQRSVRSVSSCLNEPHSRSLQKRAVDRRRELFEALRAEHQLKTGRMVRDTATALATNHQSSQTGLNQGSNPFGSSVSCTLTPEVTIGPYWVSGELIRKDVREGQGGVTVYLDIQVIDVKTCKPVPYVYLDLWHCNSTGVYAGVVADGNGDSSGNGILNSTFLRGLQPTNSDGYAQFITLFPGHYAGRTNHIHTMAHMNGALLPNNTYSSGTIPHIGQIFFDQSLISRVEALPPYNQNTVQQTQNANDGIFQQASATADDPVMHYVQLTNNLQDGLLGWITLGIDLTADQTSQASAHSTWTANGGVDNGNTMGGGGGPCGGMPPNGTGGPGPGGMGPPPQGGMMGAGGMPPNGGMPGGGGPGCGQSTTPGPRPSGTPPVTPVNGTPGLQSSGTPSPPPNGNPTPGGVTPPTTPSGQTGNAYYG